MSPTIGAVCLVFFLSLVQGVMRARDRTDQFPERASRAWDAVSALCCYPPPGGPFNVPCPPCFEFTGSAP